MILVTFDRSFIDRIKIIIIIIIIIIVIRCRELR